MTDRGYLDRISLIIVGLKRSGCDKLTQNKIAGDILVSELGLNKAVALAAKIAPQRLLTYLFTLPGGLDNVNTALVEGASRRRVDIVKLALQNGAIALSTAVDNGLSEMVALLIKLGAEVSLKAAENSSKAGLTEIVFMLLKKKPDLDLEKLLVSTSTGGCFEPVKMFVAMGAPIDITVLGLAVESGNKEMIEFLMRLLPKTIDLIPSPIYLSSRSVLTAYIVKALKNNATSVPDVIPIEWYNKELLLTQAFLYGHLDIVQQVIKAGASNLNEVAELAAEGNNVKVLDYLLTEGANDWNLILQGATHSGNLDLVKRALEKGAKNLNLALINAAKGGHLETVEILLESDADDLDKALLAAVSKSRFDVVDLLQKRGGGIKIEEALYQATKSGDLDMVKLVTKHGLYKLDECMNQAMLMKRYDIIKFFLSLGVPSLLKYMSRATNLDLLKEFIKLGGNDWDGVMVNAALAGDLDLVKDMVARGAKNYKPAMAKAYAKNHIDVFIFLFRQIGGDVEIPASLIRPDNDLNRLKKV